MSGLVRSRFVVLAVVVTTACGGGGSGSSGTDSGGPTTTGDTGATETDGTGTMGDPDLGTNPGGECMLTDDMCPDGTKCAPWSESPLDGTPDKNLCCPVSDMPKAVGDDCTMAPPYGSCEDDCQKGSMCVVDVLTSLTGVCQKFCDPRGDDCDPDQICKVFFEAFEDTQEVPLCSDTCDPLIQDCPRTDWICMPEVPVIGDGGGFVCIPPAIGTVGDPGDPCSLGNSCGAGGVCAVATAVPGCTESLCCTRYCDLSDPNADTACDADLTGTICVSQGAADPKWSNVGICALP